jgi:hypothetical protein
MASYTVKLNFNDGVNNYDLLHVSKILDPAPGSKATIIEGNRASGAIVIPGGKKSIRIIIKGVIFDSDGFADLETAIEDMKSKVTTSVATLTLKYWTGSIWQNVWAYTVRRVNEIDFPESLRTDAQEYDVEFLVISYS